MARIRSRFPDTRLRQRMLCTGEPMRLIRAQLAGEGGPLMPVAIGGQHQLEAALLIKLNCVARPRSGPVVLQAHLSGDALALRLADEVIDQVVATCLPALGPQGFIGIPGLRPVPRRDHLDLRLIGAPGVRSGTVRLLGVSQGRWRSVARALSGDPQCRPLWLDHERPHRQPGMDICEQQAHADVAAAPTELMSAVLRRFPMLRAAAWVHSVVEGDAVFLEWSLGATATVAAAILGESACRIPGVSVTPERVSATVYQLLLSCAATTDQVSQDPAWAWDQLRSVNLAADLDPAVPSRRPVTPQVWEMQEMRDALARREISAVYRLLRRHGVSQRQIAALTGQSQSEVSEILKGRQVMAYDVLARIAQGLGVPRGYMGLAYDEATAVRVAATAEAPHSEEDESVKRRKFLAHAAAILVGAAVFGTDSRSWASSPAQTPAPGRVGMTDVRQVEAATRALRTLNYQYGGGTCYDAVVAQLHWARSMLNADATPVVRERVHAAVAGLHELAGHTSYAAGYHDRALTHFTAARRLTDLRDVHDNPLRLWTPPTTLTTPTTPRILVPPLGIGGPPAGCRGSAIVRPEVSDVLHRVTCATMLHRTTCSRRCEAHPHQVILRNGTFERIALPLDTAECRAVVPVV